MKIEDTYHYGLDNRELDHDRVKCAKCGHEQFEMPHPLDKGGKYAWSCDRCWAANEGGKLHLLSDIADFDHKGVIKN